MRLTLAGAYFIGLMAIVVPIAAQAASCPDRPIPSQFDEQELRRLNKLQWEIGPRPTGSKNHENWINTLEAELARIPNLAVRSITTEIRRWQEGRTSLRVAGADVPVVSPAPYSKATGPAGETGGLRRVRGTGRFGNNDEVSGKMVVRDMPKVLGHESGARLEDLEDAKTSHAKGLIYLSNVQDSQLKGFYIPYQGTVQDVPAVYLGRDASKRVNDAIDHGGAYDATIVIEAEIVDHIPTRALIATIVGSGSEKIVIESHTDGVNAIWDNGPVAMVLMARYFAMLPAECRKKTVEFVFVTGHLYQQGMEKGGAKYFAKQLDEDYDSRPSAVVVLEHLGARNYVINPSGALEPSGQSELLFVVVSHSDPLKAAVTAVLDNYGLHFPGTLVGPGIPAPLTWPLTWPPILPPHCSFGGEGTPYNQHLLPTVAAIAAPAYLFMPSFGLETIDFPLMQHQTLAFTELVLKLDQMSQADIAGKVTEFRKSRAQGAASSCNEDASHMHLPSSAQ